MVKTAGEQLAYWHLRKSEEEQRVLTAADHKTREAHRRMALAYALRLAGEPIG